MAKKEGNRKDTRTPEELVAAGLCMHGDGKPLFCRGCCATDYRVCDRKKRSGEATDQEMVAMGLWMPAAPRGVKGGSEVEKKFRKLAKRP